MHCQSCKFEITTNMTHAVKQNICPACGDTIMSVEKMEQYVHLRQMLARHQLTNNPDVEVKLRERLIVLLLEHFNITPIKGVKIDEELIDLSEQTTIEVNAEATTEATTEANAEEGTVSVVSSEEDNDEKEDRPQRITRGGSQVQDGKHVMPISDDSGGSTIDQMRREVYNEAYGEQKDAASQDGKISIEEAKEFFPGHEAEVGNELDTEEQVQSLQEVARSGKSVGGRLRRLKQ